jgi:glycosyltransferase involved in cell wall biosynthesis
MHPVRVAIVNRHPNDVLGGSEMQCHNIAIGLTERGHDVTYVAPAGSGQYETPYRVHPVAPSASAIAAEIIRLRPDIVYWRLNKYHFLGTVRRLAREKIPVVFAISHINDTRIVSYIVNPWSSLPNLARAAKQSLQSATNYLGFRYVSAITSLNPDYLGRLPVKTQKFVPNSVQLEAAPFEWPNRYVVWVANIKQAKRPEMYIKLAHALAHKGVDFLMVGAIPAKEYQWIAHGARGVHYLGKKSLAETNGIIADAIALVHTCKPEGFPNNFLQAWLQGVPTVSLGYDPAGYITKYDLGGHAADDWTKFQEQVERLIDDRQAARDAGKRAKDFADERFSIERTVNTIELFLNQILGSAGRCTQ